MRLSIWGHLFFGECEVREGCPIDSLVELPYNISARWGLSASVNGLLRSKTAIMSASLYCSHCGALNQPQAATCFACGRSLTELAPAATDARRLARERYRIVRQLGVGGFGAVYQAEDIALGNRSVALKEMSPRGLKPDEAKEATEAFQREALLLAGLAHPSLPRIYARFEEEGRWYLVMDFIAGETLEVYLDKRGGYLPVKEVLHLALQLTEVLGYLHRRQPPIIFRDLKPSNIMRTPEGQMVLVDFGIARLFKPGQSKDTIAFGSPGYAAPEQYGKAQTTPRSDIFSLGVLLHQLLTGIDPVNRPFHFAPLTMPRPAGLSELIERMVDVDEAKRPSSMEVVQREITMLLDERTPWRADDQALTGVSFSKAWGTTGAQPASYGVPPIQPLPSTTAAPPVVRPSKKRGRWIVLAVMVMSLVVGIPGLVALASSGPSPRTSSGVSSNSDGNGLFSSTPFDPFNGTPVHPSTATPSSAGSPTPPSTPPSSGTPTAMPTPNVPVIPVYTMAWSPSGDRIASAGRSSDFQVWDAASGNKIMTITTSANQIYGLVWSPDSQYIADVGDTGGVQLWAASTGASVATFKEAPLTIDTLAWSPDSTRLALACGDGTVRVISASDGSTLVIYRGHNEPVYAVAWSPDGKYIASGGNDRTVQIWDSGTGNTVYTFQARNNAINSLAWSPDGKRVVYAGSANQVEAWDALTGQHLIAYIGSVYGANAVAWSPDGNYIAVGDSLDRVLVWSAGTGTLLYTYGRHTYPVRSLGWSPDSSRIASASLDGTVQVWDALTGKNAVTYQQP